MAKTKNAGTKAPKTPKPEKGAQADAPQGAGPIPATETRPAAAEVERTDAAPAEPTEATPPSAEPESDIAGTIGPESSDPADAGPPEQQGDQETSDDEPADPRFQPPDYPDDGCANTAEYRVIGSPIFEEGRQYKPGDIITLTTERARALGRGLIEGPLPL